MRERDVLSTEINNLNYPDPFLDASRIQDPYQPGRYSDCYMKLDPGCRKKIAQEVDKQFRRVTGFVDTLPSISNVRNEKKRHMIRTWLRFCDIILPRQ